ncbi:MAG: tail fiber domain-containing protein, partial [Bacteroidota bacterium]
TANMTGQFNTALGKDALVANTTGNANAAFGYIALAANTTGIQNTAIGTSALTANTTGGSNAAIGSGALTSNTAGLNNTASGTFALRLNTTGNGNTAHGVEALNSNTNGTANAALGRFALFANTSGASNTGLGFNALATNTTGSNNTALGRDADVSSNNLTNATAIGYNAKVNCSECLVLGGTGSDSVNVGIGTATPAYPLHLKVVGNGFTQTAGSIELGTFADPDYAPAGGWFGTLSDHPLHFFTFNSAAPQMTLTQNGDLGIGTSTIPASIKLQVQGNIGMPSGNSVYVGGVTNSGADGLRMHQAAGGSYIDHKGAGDLLFRADNVNGATPRMTIQNGGNVGIGRNPVTNILEVEGDASKSSAGDWLANSDARLKKNIQPLNSQLMLQSLLALQGIAYEWNDNQTGSKRPEGIQYGFTAQNIREVFPTLVEEDKLGFLQTAYGTYDAMTVEAIRALDLQIEQLKIENVELRMENATFKSRLETQTSQLDKITAALAGAGIAVEK